MRSAIVESVCKAAQVKVAAELAEGPGNIVDVLVDAGFDPEAVLVACCAVSGVSSARRAWLDGPLPPWPEGLDPRRCRQLGIAPITVYRGGLILAFTDPETAARAHTLGLPPHRAALALAGDLERFHPRTANVGADPFAASSTQVIATDRDTRDDTAVGDGLDDDSSDGDGDGDGDFLDDNQPSEELFVDSFADRVRPPPASTRLPPPPLEPGRLPPLQPTLKPAPRASTTSTTVATSATSTPSIPATASTSTSLPSVSPLDPPMPPRRPVRLATKRAPPEAAPVPKPPAFEPAMVVTPPSRTKLLVAAAAVVVIGGGAALLALRPAPVTAVAPPIAVKDGQLDLGKRQAELVARARAETDHALAVRLVSEAIRLDPTSPASLPAYVERVRRAGALGRWQQVDTDLARLRRRTDFPSVEADVRTIEADLQQKRLSTTLSPTTPTPTPPPATGSAPVDGGGIDGKTR